MEIDVRGLHIPVARVAFPEYNSVRRRFEEMLTGFSDAELTTEAQVALRGRPRHLLLPAVVAEDVSHPADVGHLRDLRQNRLPRAGD